MISDDALVEAVRRGELVAFDQLMRRYEKLICKVGESINWIRKHRRQSSEITLEEWSGAAAPAPQESSVLDRENRRLVLQGLAALNPKYRLAVALRYAEGLRVRDIADVMECSEGMVKSLLFRGVRQIRRNVERSA